MSWPVRMQGRSYQVCLGCGIKRLFDEQTFTSYGPYSYDIHKLLARVEPIKKISTEEFPSEERSA